MSGEREESSATKGVIAGGLRVWLSLSLLINFALGLVLVWVNTERTGLGYELRALQQRFAEEAAYSTKLELERDRLLSPYYLEQKARDLGMTGAKPGQVRRLE